jgi:hypothetical protein
LKSISDTIELQVQAALKKKIILEGKLLSNTVTDITCNGHCRFRGKACCIIACVFGDILFQFFTWNDF